MSRLLLPFRPHAPAPEPAPTRPAAAARRTARRRLALAGAALLLILASAVGVDDLLWRGAHAAAAVSAVTGAILDPAAIFAARSPGGRGSGPLLQTKHERTLAALHAPPVLPEVPEERVLAATRERPVEPDLAPPAPPLPLNDAPPGVGPLAPGGIGPAAFNPGPSALSPLPAAELFAPGSPPGGGPPGDGSPPGGGGPPTVPTVPPTSPAPEPSVWMLMMLALFGVGAALRRRRSAQPDTGDASAGSNA